LIFTILGLCAAEPSKAEKLNVNTVNIQIINLSNLAVRMLLKMLLSILLVCTIFVTIYLHTPKFGNLPEGLHLERIKKSSNYRNGNFQNIHSFNFMTHSNKITSFFEFFAKREKIHKIPSTKTDLINLNKTENVLVWFGHSSYFIQIEGKRILVDPVFSEISSPIPFWPKAFPGSNVYTSNDIPEIDYLIITHDHWDHLDYKTIKNIKASKIICPLGVGAHFERWRINNFIEMDWYEIIKIDNNFKIHCFPAKHFSGRGFLRNKTLWASFLIEVPTHFNIFIGGDGGYDTHFTEIGNKFGSVDLAILENGQYNKNWKDIHMHPYETIQAAEDLKAKALLPVHVAKFSLSTHSWNEPLETIFKLSQNKGFKLLTPMIGQKVSLQNVNQSFKKWWDTTSH
jgi:L-ascorbate metabolism protein UlaG (beta-lactamase superfamily)